MKHIFKRIIPLPLIIAVLLLAAAVLLACGPVTQAEPEGQPVTQSSAQESDAEPTPTPTPTPTPEPPKYPNLDTLLQGLVAKYEAGDLSETVAAARAPIYHEGSIFVDVQFSTDADAVARWRKETGLTRLWPYVDDVERWLGENQSGALYRPEPYMQPYIYAYVPVSKLGVLSQREGVTLVKALQDKDGSFAASQGPGGASGASGRSATEEGNGPSYPFHPEWTYPLDPYAQIGSRLGELVWRYDQGALTAEQVVDEYGSGEGSAVEVEIYLKADPANTNTIAAWLRSKGVTPDKVETHEVYDNLIVADVPVSLLVDLIKQDPGMNIESAKGVSGETGRPSGLLPSANPVPPLQQYPLGEPGSDSSWRQGLANRRILRRRHQGRDNRRQLRRFRQTYGGRFALGRQGGGPVLYQGNRILNHTLVHPGLEPESKDLNVQQLRTPLAFSGSGFPRRRE